MRKIGPELTSVANPPLFWMWDTASTWLDEQCIGLHPGSEPWATKAECVNLITTPLGRPHEYTFYHAIFGPVEWDQLTFGTSSPLLSLLLAFVTAFPQSGLLFSAIITCFI